MRDRTRADLERAPVVGRCEHVTVDDRGFARVWQHEGAVVICRVCYQGTRDAIVAGLVASGREQAWAIRYFRYHSVIVA